MPRQSRPPVHPPPALHQCTFVVVDVETTGTSPGTDLIAELGAVKVRGGKQVGTFSPLVNPGRAIPATVTTLTGVTSAMITKAPRIEPVLASFLEFLGTPLRDVVFVGHNVGFDAAFVGAALERAGYAVAPLATLDTLMLSRRLFADDCPDHRLGTLAAGLELDHAPNHRALDDALATADLLHLLLERAAGMAVADLEDLRTLPALARHPQAEKLRLTSRLPRSPGVYLLRDRHARVLFVGAGADVRATARAHFQHNGRTAVPQMLGPTRSMDHKKCSSMIEALVLQRRLVDHLCPPHNDRSAEEGARYLTWSAGSARVQRTRKPLGGRRSIGPVREPLAPHTDPVLQRVAAMRQVSRRNALLGCDRLVLRDQARARHTFERGILTLTSGPDGLGEHPVEMTPPTPQGPAALLPLSLAMELDTVLDWIDHHASDLAVEHASGDIALDL
ncbi:MAG: hypothetical protein GY812_15025 [Actinomycetia bacterium]|nr:hypothetical protein [Actinomycetes bacterium]